MGDKVPEAWTNSITVTIWKASGDAINWANYRPIHFLCHTMKIFVRILDAHLRQIVIVMPNQCRFVKVIWNHSCHSCCEATWREAPREEPAGPYGIRRRREGLQQNVIPTHMAHPTTHGVQEAYIDWVKVFYMKVTSAVRCPAGVSPSTWVYPRVRPFRPSCSSFAWTLRLPISKHLTHGHSSTPITSSWQIQETCGTICSNGRHAWLTMAGDSTPGRPITWTPNNMLMKINKT